MSGEGRIMDEIGKYKAALVKAAEKINELDAELKSLQQKDEIAIIGYHCRFPGGANDPQLFWEKLMQGYDAVTEIKPDRFDPQPFYSKDSSVPGKMYTKSAAFLDHDIKTFDYGHFEISAVEAASLDPQQKLLLELSWEALENAGIDIAQLRGSKTGVFIGLDEVDYISREVFSGNVNDLGPYSAIGISSHATAGRIAYFYDFKGPAICINSACSSSLSAMNMAVDSLRGGQCDLAIVAGANLLLNPESFIGLSQFHALSPDGRCKTFDASADGFGRGEGGGVILLKRAVDAKRDSNTIEAFIRAIYIGQDGRSNGFYAPNGLGEQRVIEAALKQGGLSQQDIDYIEAHGTGTSLGDFIETQAICDAFKDRHKPILIGSVKSNIGHLEAAAGIAGVIKVLLSLKHQCIPPSIHFNQPNPNIDWEKMKVVTEPVKWQRGDKKRRAGISSFGISGNLVHVILEESQPEEDHSWEEKPQFPECIITISTKNKGALVKAASDIRDFISRSTENLSDIAYSTNVTRAKNEYRLAVVGNSREHIIKTLDSMIGNQEISRFYMGRSTEKRKKTAFLFTGQGSIYENAAQEFYQFSSAFRNAFNRCDERFKQLLGISVIDALYKRTGDHLNNALYSQPVIFSLEYSLTKIWDNLNIVPDYVIGHSIGEYAALCYSKILSFEDITNMVALRSRLMSGVKPNGKMVGVLVEEGRMREIINKSDCHNVSIAAVNAPKNVTVSGLAIEVDQVIDLLQQQERVFVNDLGIRYPYHSVEMNNYTGSYGDCLDYLTGRGQESPVKVISSVTGKLEDYHLFEDKYYWMQHLENTVNFKAAMEQAEKLGVTAFIEIGGTATLCGLAGQCMENQEAICVPTLRNGIGSYKQLSESLKHLYLNGLNLQWDGLYKEYQVKKVALPGYAFDRRTSWKDRSHQLPASDLCVGTADLLLNKQRTQLLEQRSYLKQMLESEKVIKNIGVEEITYD